MPDPDFNFPTTKMSNLVSHHYIERPALSNRLHELLIPPEDRTIPSVVLVHGLAGSGKTQLVRRWAKEWLLNHSYSHWFDASSLETLNSSFVDFAAEAGIFRHATNTSHKSTVQQVIKYISELQGEWLLVFDNFDLPEKQRFDLRHFFPEGSRGKVIVTSRNKDIGDEIGAEILYVDIMSEEEAVDLLRKSANIINNTQDVEQKNAELLVATDLLGSLPLAIAQGGAFIKKVIRGPSNTQRLSEYSSTFRRHKARMLGDKYGTLVSLYGESVITSWDMSFEVVMMDNNTAAQLFLLMGFFHHSNIPRALFASVHDSKTLLQAHDGINITYMPFEWVGDVLESTENGKWDETNFNVSMAVLESFSLVRNINDVAYDIHPLVHTWTRISRHAIPELNDRAQLVLAMLAKVFQRDLDSNSTDYRTIQVKYYDHVLSCLDSIQSHTDLLDKENSCGPKAITLLRIQAILDGQLLFSEHRARKLKDRLIVLSLLQGSRTRGIDEISSVQALRKLLVRLAVIKGYATQMEPLIDMLSHLLVVAAANNSTVDLVEQQMSIHFLRLTALRYCGENTKIHHQINDIQEFLESHREELGTREYLFKSVITLGVLRTQVEPSERPKMLENMDALIQEMKTHLGDKDMFYIFKAKCDKANCLREMGRREEALALARENLALAMAFPGIDTDTITANTFCVNGLLIREEENLEIVENCRFASERMSKELGPYHEDVLLEKRRIIEFERRHHYKSGLISRLKTIDPNIFGVDHCEELPDAMVVLTLELAIVYKAFQRSHEIEPLWDGVLKQAQLEGEGEEELISQYATALEVAAEATHQAEYRAYRILLQTSAAKLRKISEESKNEKSESRYIQLKQLRVLWEDLSVLFERHTSTTTPGQLTLPVAQKILSSIKSAARGTQPAMLFLTNHFLEWMIHSDACLSLPPFSPVSCLVLKSLETLSAEHFGAWYDSMNTLRAKVSLTVCQRQLGQEANALQSENELLDCRIREAKTQPRFIPGRGGVHLIPGTLGIEELHNDYRRREWYLASLRLYELAYNDFLECLGVESETTVTQLKYICELCGKLDMFDRMDPLLQRFEKDLEVGDSLKKGK
jgi:hypothetical protein